MRLMPLLRLGEPEQDLALLASPALGQLPITRRLGALVGEVLAASRRIWRGVRVGDVATCPSWQSPTA
jgi:hypothetical protein